MSRHNMNAGIPIIFRSYQGVANQAPDCTIWEALCATMAHPDLFKSIKIGTMVQEYFVDGGLGCNNPLSQVLAEVKAMCPGRYVGSIVSIGAGHTQTIQIPKSGWSRRFLPTNAIVAMKGIAEDSERVAEDMAIRFEKTKNIYHRFNVDQGLQSVEIGEWERLEEVAAQARAYMRQSMTVQRIGKAAQAIIEKKPVVTTAQIGMSETRIIILHN